MSAEPLSAHAPLAPFAAKPMTDKVDGALRRTTHTQGPSLGNPLHVVVRVALRNIRGLTPLTTGPNLLPSNRDGLALLREGARSLLNLTSLLRLTRLLVHVVFEKKMGASTRDVVRTQPTPNPDRPTPLFKNLHSNYPSYHHNHLPTKRVTLLAGSTVSSVSKH